MLDGRLPISNSKKVHSHDVTPFSKVLAQQAADNARFLKSQKIVKRKQMQTFLAAKEREERRFRRRLEGVRRAGPTKPKIHFLHHFNTVDTATAVTGTSDHAKLQRGAAVDDPAARSQLSVHVAAKSPRGAPFSSVSHFPPMIAHVALPCPRYLLFFICAGACMQV
jgi:hypothetical protein